MELIIEVALGLVAGVVLLAILPTMLQLAFAFVYYAFVPGGKKR